jgi:serine/threonine protein kinase
MSNSIISYLDDELNEDKVEIIPKDDITIFKPFIGRGKFGKVYKGEFKGVTIAIKKMMFEEEDVYENKKDISKEIKNIKLASCKEVPEFYGVWKGKKGKYYHLVFEFIDGVTLRSCIKELCIKTKLKIVFQICQVMSTFHKQKFFHRDLKPENIMIVNKDEIQVKLIDFGTARLAQKTLTHTSTAIGTSFYMAPDNFDIEEDAPNPEKPIATSFKVDIWSIGCIFCEMLTEIFPWHNLTKNETKVESMLIHKKPFPIPNELNTRYPEFRTILEKCFEINPEDRCNCEDIINFVKPYIID